MGVGATIGKDQMDNIITSLAVHLREIMQDVADTNLSVNGQAQGLAYLQSIGYSNVSNPNNPGSVSDAQYALNMIAYLNTVAGVYFGTATQATMFNFNQALSQMWGGHVGPA